MLEFIDESIEGFLRACVPLSATEIDVSFEAPERSWSAKLNRPTVNVFLWDIARSTERARTGLEDYERGGVQMRRMALPRVELRYLVTTWTSEHSDERALVGSLMQTVLAHSRIPEEFVAEPLRELSPLAIMLARSGESKLDVFRTLEGQLKPALDLMIVAEVDTDLGRATAAPVQEMGVSISDRNLPQRTTSSRRVAGEVHVAGAAGRRVVSPRGSTTVDPYGRFLVRAAAGDELTIDLDPPRTVVVPEVGGVVVI